MTTLLPLLLLCLSGPQTPESSQVSPAAAEVPEGQVCGLGAAFHAGRRAALCELVGSGWMVFRGLDETRDYLPFRQDKTFWYLTGVESPRAALAMNAATGEELLFLPRANPMLEVWEGEKWDASDAWIPALTGFEDVRDVDGLEDFLAENLVPGEVVWTSLAAHIGLAGCYDRAEPFDKRAARDGLDGRPSRELALEAALEETYGVKVKDCQTSLEELRRVKTPEEIAALRRASDAGAASMRAAMANTKPGVTEAELGALMSFVHLREGATGPAYAPIIGAGSNANVLHYLDLTRTLAADHGVLVDYAPEYDHYVSDITRTWPASGEFSPRLAELYDIVLEAQLAGIAAVKPGATLDDVQRACNGVINAADVRQHVLHGVSHYVGMEVHDVGGYRKPLEPGVVFTIEPGLYDQEAGVGVRIEDVILVTEDGCEVLSAAVPKQRSEIEALVGTAGLLR
ncbi:MAG: Xaa-Pro peptidase family protein [Planctomycetota bacterium]|nr:Xaa-Pro peptidase family protein [Planctomycetota bacterium]